MRNILTFALCALALAGCDARKKKPQVGPVRDWIVGTWIRTDDHLDWNFASNNEMTTGGRVPIGGSYSTEEPNKVKVHISGANAVSAAAMLGLRVDQNQNLYINFQVDGDEMRVTDVASTVLFVKR
ncbi:MAG: hypothetical protein JO332_20065 [Planctomycetaceae bacterium]|nr:hypothetical protein [Planctomycetaceae bacterium]